jgi:myo-inositol-1-phosphate synthase
MAKVGMYLIGARGNVAATAVAGLLALRDGVSDGVGLVTALPEFGGLPLAGFGDIAVGGCDIVGTDLGEKVATLAEESILSRPVAATYRGELSALGATFATVDGRGEPKALAESNAALLMKFRLDHNLDRVVVVNVSSTEKRVEPVEAHGSLAAFESALKGNMAGVFSNAMLWAWASFTVGAAFVNFTPSQGGEIPALVEMSRKLKLAQAGKDGKTGETLLKTVLGPMFAQRNLRVMSWLANNYLGNEDGRSLSDPVTRATKLKSKDEALRSILGRDAHLATDIGYAPSLGDWKTAWDLIHFEGFLGSRMTMQFTWQGCDSALAAPLVIDLVRLVDWAMGRGESGPLEWLACFFKSPMSADAGSLMEHGFARQVAMLQEHVR